MRRSVSNKDDDEFVTHVERFDSSGKKTAGQPGRKSGCSSLVAKSRVCTYVAHVYLEVPYIRICRWKHILHTILYYHYKECRIYASNKQVCERFKSQLIGVLQLFLSRWDGMSPFSVFVNQTFSFEHCVVPLICRIVKSYFAIWRIIVIGENMIFLAKAKRMIFVWVLGILFVTKCAKFIWSFCSINNFGLLISI